MNVYFILIFYTKSVSTNECILELHTLRLKTVKQVQLINMTSMLLKV